MFNFPEGEVLLIDKPLEWTSFDVVKKVRGAIRMKKIGHAGTLDPLATGLLILCTGKKTKQIEHFQAQVKEYTGEITIGSTTPTYDLESDPENFKDFAHISETDLQKASEKFVGQIEQTPPIHSAVKVDGKRAYELARKGKEVKLKTRLITIERFELTQIELPKIQFRVVCSKGTYIRSLAHDFGQTLGVGAHLSALRRTAIGEFRAENAWELDKLVAQIKAEREQNLSSN